MVFIKPKRRKSTLQFQASKIKLNILIKEQIVDGGVEMDIVPKAVVLNEVKMKRRRKRRRDTNNWGKRQVRRPTPKPVQGKDNESEQSSSTEQSPTKARKWTRRARGERVRVSLRQKYLKRINAGVPSWECPRTVEYCQDQYTGDNNDLKKILFACSLGLLPKSDSEHIRSTVEPILKNVPLPLSGKDVAVKAKKPGRKKKVIIPEVEEEICPIEQSIQLVNTIVASFPKIPGINDNPSNPPMSKSTASSGKSSDSNASQGTSLESSSSNSRLSPDIVDQTSAKPKPRKRRPRVVRAEGDVVVGKRSKASSIPDNLDIAPRKRRGRKKKTVLAQLQPSSTNDNDILSTSSGTENSSLIPTPSRTGMSMANVAKLIITGNKLNMNMNSSSLTIIQ